MRYQEMSFGKKQKRISLIHMNKPIQNGIVGLVTSRMFSDKIAIIIDNIPDEECDRDFACLACGKNGSVPRIIMSREVFYDIKRGKPYARFILLHELGHYFHQHHLIQNKYRDEERAELASNDEASEEEIKADLFAAEYLGIEKAVEGLNCICDHLKEEYGEQDDNLAIVLKEIYIRKKNLQG